MYDCPAGSTRSDAENARQAATALAQRQGLERKTQVVRLGEGAWRVRAQFREPGSEVEWARVLTGDVVVPAAGDVCPTCGRGPEERVELGPLVGTIPATGLTERVAPPVGSALALALERVRGD